MADPISMVISVAGVAQAALSAIQAISTTISNIKDAPHQIQDLGNSARGLVGVLTRIRDDTIGLAWHDKIVDTVKECTGTCVEINDVLDKWSKRPAWVIGVFKEDRLAAYGQQLTTLRVNIQEVFNISQGLEIIKQGVDQGKQLQKLDRLNDILEAIKGLQVDAADKHGKLQIAKVETQKKEVIRADYENDAEAAEAEEDKAALDRQLDRQMRFAKQMQVLCDSIRKDVEVEAGQNINSISTQHNSVALCGNINVNPDKISGRQELSGITTSDSSFTFVGNYNDADMAGLAALRGAGASK